MSAEADRQSPPKSQSAGPVGKEGGEARVSRPALRYVDRPDCNETFADSISRLSFDGQTLRIEFAVARIDETNAENQVTGRLYPACRLVLTPSAAADLMQKLQQVASALARARIQKQSQSVQEGVGSDKKNRNGAAQ